MSSISNKTNTENTTSIQSEIEQTRKHDELIEEQHPTEQKSIKEHSLRSSCEKIESDKVADCTQVKIAEKLDFAQGEWVKPTISEELNHSLATLANVEPKSTPDSPKPEIAEKSLDRLNERKGPHSKLSNSAPASPMSLRRKPSNDEIQSVHSVSQLLAEARDDLAQLVEKDSENTMKKDKIVITGTISNPDTPSQARIITEPQSEKQLVLKSLKESLKTGEKPPTEEQETIEKSEKIPTTPPSSPAVASQLVRCSLDSVGLLSPDNSMITFGCLDDTLVRKRKLITVCMHGDEVCGMIAINQLINERFFQKYFRNPANKRDRLTILVGNPKGVKANKRYIDVNLNRIFHSSHIRPRNHRQPSHYMQRRFSVDLVSSLLHRAPPLAQCYELGRIQTIAEAIEDSDEYIDIHSTSAKSYPFALPALDQESEEFARTFCIDYVIEKLIKSVKGTSIGWATAMHKKAVCFECGQHEDPEAIDTAKKVIRRFVTDKIVERGAKAVLSCETNEIIHKGFKYKKPIKAFERVEYNTLIAEDDEVGEIRCEKPNGAYIIMPTANPIIGEEAWFWGDLVYIREEEKFTRPPDKKKFYLRKSQDMTFHPNILNNSNNNNVPPTNVTNNVIQSNTPRVSVSTG